MKMTFQEIRIIATAPCIANQLRDVNTICRSFHINELSITVNYKKHKTKNVHTILITCVFVCDFIIILYIYLGWVGGGI
jgi:hypothetical protein